MLIWSDDAPWPTLGGVEDVGRHVSDGLGQGHKAGGVGRGHICRGMLTRRESGGRAGASLCSMQMCLRSLCLCVQMGVGEEERGQVAGRAVQHLEWVGPPEQTFLVRQQLTQCL